MKLYNDEELACLLDQEIFHQIGDCADELGVECYVVGGYLRDLFLERPSKDTDVVVVGSGIEVAKLLKKNPDVDGCVEDLIAYDNSRWTFTEDDERTFRNGNALVDLTRATLESYYSKPVNYNCFENWDFTQNMSPDFVIPQNLVVYMNAINDMRRFETNWEGLRFFDLKRWGMEYSHFYSVDNIEYKLTWNDPRRAIEVPQEVMAAGLAPSRPPLDYTEFQQATELRKTK
jgi:hypothetical protein